MRFQRGIQERLRTLAQHFPAIVLTGARQTGKTTLLRHLFPTMSYVSLDLPSLAEKADRDPQTFLRENPPPVIVDEVQYAPGLFRHLKTAIDENRHAYGQYLLTGSQKFTLMKEVSDSLAGRAAILELETLSPEELQSHLKDALQSRGAASVLARGFFPQLWAEPDMPSHEFYRSYIATYLERDVRQILNVSSLRDFERFMRACALRSGHVLNKSELAKDVGIHQKTANDWLSILQASNQILLLEPYFSNETKRITKMPKLYFTETGILCALLGLTENTIGSYANVGNIWETFLFSRIRKHLEATGSPTSIWYYRDASGLEVDFLLEEAGRLRLIEGKWTQYPDTNDAAAMMALSQKLKNIEKRFVACRTTEAYPVGQAQAVDGFLSTEWLTGLPLG